MTLLDAREYDPVRERRRKIILAAVVVAVIVIGVLAFFWTTRWQYARLVDSFFDALQQQDYEAAYAIWMNDPDWKQHPEKYKHYPFGEFYIDWGPGGEWGLIRSYQVEGARPTGGSGVVVVVTVNQRIDPKARIWVEKRDKTLGFSPY